MQAPAHAFTIDAEDWAALMCMYLGQPIPVSRQFSSTIHRVLDLLDEYQVKSTFFVVATHAAQEPQAVQEILARGHELGSHGWTHQKIYTFSPDEFRDDIQRSVATLEDITGQKVYGHRCPFFSLLPDHPWALEAMAEVGLEYDSSITTLLWEKAGFPVPEQPFSFALPSGGSIVEFPTLARKVGPLTARYIGGRGIRVFPRSFCLKHLEERERAGLPAMVYLHTYEVMPDKLMRYVPPTVGFKDRCKLALSAKAFEIGLGRMRSVVGYLLANYRWAPATEVIAQMKENETLPTVSWEYGQTQ